MSYKEMSSKHGGPAKGGQKEQPASKKPAAAAKEGAAHGKQAAGPKKG